MDEENIVMPLMAATFLDILYRLLFNSISYHSAESYLTDLVSLNLSVFFLHKFKDLAWKGRFRSLSWHK